jgi:hypothetical protein
MPEYDPPQRIHIVISDDWRVAVTTLHQKKPEQRPWRGGSQPTAVGDGVATLLNTEPRSIITTLGRVRMGVDAEFSLMPVSALRGPDYGFDGDDIETWVLEGELARQLAAELNEHRSGWEGVRWGHHTMAAAAILLRAAGRCDGCREERDLEPRTVEPDCGDYPAALCLPCRRSMADNGIDTFLDFKIAKNPDCPECGQHRTLAIAYGMPVFDAMVPWYRYAGCCVSAEQWSCLECEHSW